MHLERRTIRANGIDLALAEWGAADAPPLMLLHGIGSRAESWLPVADALGRRFRCLAFDLRGHGDSGRPDRGYLLADYAADLDAAVGVLGLDRPRVLGHSLGSLVALQWASGGGRSARLALEDPPLRTAPEVLTSFDGWQRLNAAPVNDVAAWFAQEHPEWEAAACRRRAEAICGTHPAVFAELRAEAEANLDSGRVDRLDALGAIDVPTLLLHGDPALGSATRPEDIPRLARAAPGLLATAIPGAGHGIHREQPERFLAALVPFLAG